MKNQNFQPINSKLGVIIQRVRYRDIAANHDGNLERAKELIYKCAEAGANAAKFQNFFAETIVSDAGFRAWEKAVTSVSLGKVCF